MDEISSLHQWTQEKIQHHRRYGFSYRLPLNYLQRLQSGIKQYFPLEHNDLLNNLKTAIDMKKRYMELERRRMALSTEQTFQRRLNWIETLLLSFWFIELGILFSLSYMKDCTQYEKNALHICFCNCVGLAVNIIFQLVNPPNNQNQRSYFNVKPSLGRRIIKSKIRQFMMLPFIAYTLAKCLNLLQQIEYNQEYKISYRQKWTIYILIPVYSIGLFIHLLSRKQHNKSKTQTS